MIKENLEWMLDQADDIDYREGLLAYARYNMMMQRYVDKYGFSIAKVTAAFCSLSPNNDYVGNLRSLTAVLDGIIQEVPREDIVVATYNHCKMRAIAYLLNEKEFVTKTKGPKVLSFYMNILYPTNPDYATIDGHMVAASKGDPGMTMKEALVNKGEYYKIVAIVKEMASEKKLLPNQIQAIIWFTRKRLYKIKFNPNIDIFHSDDVWKILVPLESVPGYSKR